MKIKFLYTLALGFALTLGACSSDESLVADGSGDEAVVTFTAQLPASINSRADLTKNYSNGLTAKDLYAIVYEQDQKTTDEGTVTRKYVKYTTAELAVDDSGKISAKLSTRLLKNHIYTIVLWAQKGKNLIEGDIQDGDAPYTFNKDTGAISLNYGSESTANDETRDAFYYAESDIVITYDVSKTIELTRPFAQLNIGTTIEDYEAAKANGYDFQTAEVSLWAYTTFTTFDGGVANSAKLTFKAAEFPSEVFPLDFDVEDASNYVYKYLSMNYILIKSTKQTLNPLTLTVATKPESGDAYTQTFSYEYVPVQRNYRTNVYGNIFTNQYEYSVEVNNEYIGSHNYDLVEVEKGQELVDAIKSGKDVELTDDVELPTSFYFVDEDVSSTINLAGHTLTFSNNLTLSGNLEINGGSAVTSRSGESTTVKGKVVFPTFRSAGICAFIVNNTSELIIEDADVTVPVGYGIYAAANGSKVTIKNSKITASSAAIGTNASSPYSAEIKLENSEFHGGSSVLFNVPLTVEADNCDFYGSRVGAIFRGGTYNITNSRFYLDLPARAADLKARNLPADNPGGAEDQNDLTLYDAAWSQGTMVPVAALVIGNNDNNGASGSYQYPTYITSKFTGNKALIIPQEGFNVTDYPNVIVYANTPTGNGVYIAFPQSSEWIGLTNDIYTAKGKGIQYNNTSNIFFSSDSGSNYTAYASNPE
jgi:hypothetical protein